MKNNINNPFAFFFDQLRDVHSMETQLCATMNSLASLCKNEELRDLILRHAHQTRKQLSAISAIFERHGASPGDDKCKAIAGLIEGGNAHLESVPCPHTRDLMMIALCLRIEYYELAAYEITITLSGRLGLTQEPGILAELLAEETDMAAALMLLEPELFERADAHATAY